MSRGKGWIGVDLDGCLAIYDGWKGGYGIESIGEPIQLMLGIVKDLQKQGEDIRIFTARACDPEQIPGIKAWCIKHGLGDLVVTNVKDYEMRSLYDDRAIQVLPNNSGVTVRSLAVAMKERCEDFGEKFTEEFQKMFKELMER